MRRKPGIGSVRRSSPGFPENYVGVRRIVVSFDEETFAVVRLRAAKAGHSFAEEVRILVEWGLEAEPAAKAKEAAE